MRTDLAKAFYNAAGVTTRNDPDHPASRFAVDRLHEQLKRVVRPGMTALDLGCGAGRFTFAMEALGAVCTGIDCARIPLRQARCIAAQRGTRSLFCCGNVVELPFAAGRFECVLLADNIVEFSPEDVSELSAEVNRVLSPNGLFCLSLKSDSAPPGPRTSHYTVPGKGTFEYQSHAWTPASICGTVGKSLDFLWSAELEDNRHWLVFQKGLRTCEEGTRHADLHR